MMFLEHVQPLPALAGQRGQVALPVLRAGLSQVFLVVVDRTVQGANRGGFRVGRQGGILLGFLDNAASPSRPQFLDGCLYGLLDCLVYLLAQGNVAELRQVIGDDDGGAPCL